MRRGPFSPAPVSYQVTWGAGEAWMVQVSRTVVRSQTAWERSGIQNQGPRPEHSSLSSLASRTFSSVWRQEQVCDRSEPGHQLPPIFTATSPDTRLWSQIHGSWSVQQHRRGSAAHDPWTQRAGVTANLCHFLAVRP